MTDRIGINIRKRRLEIGYTSAKKFAEDHGMHRSQVLNWEKGDDIRVSSLLKVAEALKVEVTELFK